MPSRRFFAEIGHLGPFLLYECLRTVHPSPYIVYLKLDDLALVGALPLVRVEDHRVMPRPITGDPARPLRGGDRLLRRGWST